ncbi:VRR-Nuc domain protein [Streptomyces phage RosaAsantewaa]|nr:VRR-Nuc domain protein [Streptomyces phage RosaAsantewaa]
MQESVYQARLIRKLRELYPGCVILKNDPDYLQGIPDLLILFGDRWAMLEVKGSERARHQPNQDYYVRQLSEMSFAAFIYPSNEQEVLDELDHVLRGG